MDNQQHRAIEHDELDLRWMVTVLFRRKWFILAFIGVSVAVAGIISLFLIFPRYEAPVVVALPAADGSDGVGMTLPGYAEFATSAQVIAAIRQNLTSDQTANEHTLNYDVQTDSANRRLTVASSAREAEDAFILARYWTDVFSEQIRNLIVDQVATQTALAEKAAEDLRAELSNAGDAPIAFNPDSSLSFMQDGLMMIEQELVDLETRFRQLTLYSIPSDEARLVFLQNALDEEPPILARSANGVILHEEGSSHSITSGEVIILNPAYQQLSLDLADTRTRLVVNRREAEILEANIPSLYDEINQLRRAKRLYDPVGARLDRLVEMEARLPDLSQSVIVKGPSLPQASTSRGRLEIMAFAGILGTFGGMVVIYFLEWYQSSSHRPRTGKEARPNERAVP